MSLVRVSSRLKAAGAAVLAATSLLSIHADPAAAAEWPTRVRAVFDVNFNGLNVGSFEFNSSNQGPSYDLSGMGKLSLLLGAFSWTGETRATGRVAGEAIKPASFAFNYKGTSKSGSTRMSYTDDTISSVLHEPPSPPKEGVVPVLPVHLKGALDPLSAIMALSKGTSGNPCSRRLAVYDGKARFDLLLSPRGMVPLQEQRPSGQPGQGYVCRVKYVPISGHKADQETKFMSGSEGIEIILRPVPNANIFVPYRITIPTVAGPATLVSRKVDITTAGQQQIALVH